MDGKSVLSSRSTASSCKTLPKRNIAKVVSQPDSLSLVNIPALKIYPPIHNEELTTKEQEEKVEVHCQIPNVHDKYKELIKRYEDAFKLLKAKEEERVQLNKLFNKVKEERNFYQNRSKELNNEYENLVGGRRRRISRV